MKIFFTASQRGKRQFEKYYQRIWRTIKKLNYHLIADDILATPTDKFYKHLEKVGRQAHVDLYQNKVKSIQEADVCLFETSLHSLSIGYLIDKSLDFNKPTIVLYYQKNVPFLLDGIENEKLIIKEYDEKNLEEVVKKTLNEASGIKDKRFNFFINPKLLAYLERASRDERITKSGFIRNLIVGHMKEKNKLS